MPMFDPHAGQGTARNDRTPISLLSRNYGSHTDKLVSAQQSRGQAANHCHAVGLSGSFPSVGSGRAPARPTRPVTRSNSQAMRPSARESGRQ